MTSISLLQSRRLLRFQPVLWLFVLLLQFRSANAQDPLPAQCAGENGDPETAALVAGSCAHTSNLWTSNARHLPDLATRRIRVHANFIILQKADGTGNFSANDPDDIAFLNDWFERCNFRLSHLDGTSNCSPLYPDAKVEIVPNWIFMPDPTEYYWDNDNDPSVTKCPGTGWYLNPLDQTIVNNPAIPKGINVYLTVDGDVYHQMVTLGTINNPETAGMTYVWCSELPSTSNLSKPSRIHIPNLYLKYWWFKNHPEVLGHPFSETRNWLVAEGGILAHEFGHSFNLFHQDNCTHNLMRSTGGDHNTLTADQVGIMHRMLAISSLRQYVDCDETYSTSSFRAIREVGINETWDLNMRLYSDVRVKKGATLTITCKLLMPYGGVIIVERGAKLIVDGGTITKANTCSPTQYWAKIAVQGNNALPQPSATGPATNDERAGIVQLMNGAFIEEAIVGISTVEDRFQEWNESYWGGVVYSDSATFRNCRKGVEFMRYNFPNFSQFKRTNFVRTATGSSYAGVTIWDTDNIQFEKCVFDGMAQNGIRAGDAVFTVKTGCRFSGSNEAAIYAGAASPLNGDIVIGELGATGANRNTFINNIVGVQLTANTRSRIYSNDFQDFDFDVAANGWGSNTLQDNHFSGTAAGNQFNMTGTFSSNENKCNVYSGTLVGTDVVGDNQGFKFYNEDFTTNFHDLFLEGPITAPGAIALFQGSSGAARYNYFSANKPENVKTSTVQPNAYTTPFYYFFNLSAATGDPRLEPKCALNNGTCTAPSNFYTFYGTGSNPGCQLPPPCFTKPCLESVRTQLAQRKSLLEAGKSQALFAALATQGGSTSTYNSLMAASPYLSDNLLMAIVDNSAMSQKSKSNLLMSNAALTSVVMQYLPGKVSAQTISELNAAAAANPVSARTQLESQIQELSVQREAITDELILNYRSAGQWAQAETLLNEDLYDMNYRRLFGLKVEQKDYTGANTVLQSIPLNNLDDSYFVHIQAINLARLTQGAGFSLTAQQEAGLTSMAQTSTLSAGYAQSLLNMLTGAVFPPVLPELGAGSGRSASANQNSELKQAEAQGLVLTPNPASEAWTVRVALPATGHTRKLELYDLVSGRLLESFPVWDEGEHQIPVKDYANGVYLLVLHENGQVLAKQKAVVCH